MAFAHTIWQVLYSEIIPRITAKARKGTQKMVCELLKQSILLIGLPQKMPEGNHRFSRDYMNNIQRLLL